MGVSFSGLDLSFMKTKESQNHLRLSHNRAMEEKRAVPRASRRSHLPAPHVMGDIKPFVSPVGDTPEVISSRPQLRAHEKKHDVIQVGNDLRAKDVIAKEDGKKQAREDIARGHVTPPEWV